MTGEPHGLIEIERKYEVGPDFTLPDLGVLAGVRSVTPPQVHELRASYYDTAERRLARARITLRRRTGGSDQGWHLKLPAGPDARRELHAPLGTGQAVPAALAAAVADHTRGEPFEPLATLVTTRTVVRLTGAEGQVLAEVADDQVNGWLPAKPHDNVRWREVEVELVDGERPLLQAAGQLLEAAGARPAALGSKLARLLDSST